MRTHQHPQPQQTSRPRRRIPEQAPRVQIFQSQNLLPQATTHQRLQQVLIDKEAQLQAPVYFDGNYVTWKGAAVYYEIAGSKVNKHSVELDQAEEV